MRTVLVAVAVIATISPANAGKFDWLMKLFSTGVREEAVIGGAAIGKGATAIDDAARAGRFGSEAGGAEAGIADDAARASQEESTSEHFLREGAQELGQRGIEEFLRPQAPDDEYDTQSEYQPEN